MNDIPRLHLWLAAVISGCFLFVLPLRAEDWTRFRGDAQSTGVAAALPQAMAVLWTAQIEIGIESTAAIWQTAVYVGGLDEKLYAFDLDSGALMWTYRATGEIKASPLALGDAVLSATAMASFTRSRPKPGKVYGPFKQMGKSSHRPMRCPAES